MSAKWQIGDRIHNRWEIHKIFKGGMGIVYGVYDHEHRTVYAAKTFQEEALARNPQMAERFKQEALAWVNLDVHQNVVRARMVLTIEGRPLLFLDYISGGDLSGWVGTPRLTEDLPQVLRFAVQFCDGMEHVLGKGIVAHRDIKPSNCLVTEDRTLKVTDFGLARVFEGVEIEVGPGGASGESFSSRLSVTGSAFGTCAYMAPEQFQDAKHVDVRADIYSFGVMLYEMITGRQPFVGRSWEEFKRLHLDAPPPGLEAVSEPEGAVRRELSELVHSCLAKASGERPGSFGLLRAKLAELHQRLTGQQVPPPAKGQNLDAIDLTNKGASLDALGRKEEALTCCDEALRINPRDEHAWSNKGHVLSALGRKQEALKAIDEALRINSRFENAWSNKANVLSDLGRMEEALQAHDEALRINPRFEKVWSNKGHALYALGRMEEALTAYDAALRINPRFEKAWIGKGNALSALGRKQEALKAHDEALRINSRFENAWSNKGAVLSDLGRKEEALTCYDEALRINPRDEQAWFNKGFVLYALGRNEEALKAYDEALRINPRYEIAWSNKGHALFALGRKQEALKAIDEALRINPRFENAWIGKGVLLADSGLLREALPCFEQALRLGHPGAAQAIAVCRQRLDK